MEQQISKEKVDKIMTSALFKFSIKCLRKYMKIKPKGNYAFSPYNIYEALFSVYLTSSGAIENRLKHILYLTEVDSKNDLIDTVNFNKYSLNSPNSASTSNDVQLETNASANHANENMCSITDCVYSVSTRHLHSEATEPLAAHDFENESMPPTEDNISTSLQNLELKPNEAACNYEAESMCWIKKDKFIEIPERIKNIFKKVFVGLENRTVENVYMMNREIRWQTKNYICDPVQLSMENGNMEIVLTSILRFNNQDFQKSTTPQPDASSESTVSDKKKRKNFFCNQLDAFVSEFPYKNGNASLFMLISASCIPITNRIQIHFTNSKLRKLIKRLSTDAGICKLRSLLDSDEIRSNIKEFSFWPVFEIAKNLKIRKLLQALEVEQLLTSDAINLDPYFTGDTENVRYGHVAHRTHVNVTKEYTKAGAMTLFTGQKFDSKVSKMAEINSKYPFVWLIYDKRQRDILFIGACRRPTVWETGIRTGEELSHSESNTSNMRPVKQLLETDL